MRNVKSRKAVTNRFIRFDAYFEKLRVQGLDKAKRKEFGIYEGGFNNIDEFKKWEEALFDDREKLDAWDKMIFSTLEQIGLDEKYRNNLEQFFTLEFSGVYAVDQSALSRSRVEDQYLRNKKIFTIFQEVDPKTGKKIKREIVAKKFQPNQRETEIHFKSERKLNKWYKKIGLSEKKDPGAAVRKIVARHKKNFSS